MYSLINGHYRGAAGGEIFAVDTKLKKFLDSTGKHSMLNGVK